jgi:hypothetical protein
MNRIVAWTSLTGHNWTSFQNWICTFVNVDSRGSGSLSGNYREVGFFAVSAEFIVEEWTVLAEPAVPGRLKTLIDTNPLIIPLRVRFDQPIKTLFRQLELS